MNPAPASAPKQENRHSVNLPAGMETFNVRWLARFFHCSAQHWINLIERGAVKALPLSPGSPKSMLRIARADLDTFLNARTK